MDKVNNGQIKKQTFMISVLTIVTSQILIKLLGFIYRFVITNIPGFGDSGNGYYGAGFQIYMLLIAISSMGIPGAISKLVSERIAKNDYSGAHKIFKTAFVMFGIIGVIGASLLMFGAKTIADVVLDNPGVEYTLIILAPSIIFICMSAVVRGYFNGMQDMQASARSQTIEQIFNCILTITIVYMLIGNNAAIMAAGSSLATTLGTMLSFTYLMMFYNKRKKQIWNSINESKTKVIENSSEIIENKKRSQIMKTILALSIPISLGSIISAINRTVDAVTVIRGIKASLGYTDEMANYWYGILSGKVDMLTSFPLALNIAFSIALIPAISAALATGDTKTAAKRISFSLQLTMLIALPCMVGIIVLADPILKLLFPAASEGALLLQISSVTILFTALAQTIYGSLQGLGKVLVPAASLAIGAIVKLILNLVLIYNPAVNIYGAAIGSIACHIIASSISFYILNKHLPLNINYSKFIIKPVIANGIMGILAFVTYNTANNFFGNAISTIIAIGTAVIAYLSMIFALRILEKEDYYMIPGGMKLLKILEKVKIY